MREQPSMVIIWIKRLPTPKISGLNARFTGRFGGGRQCAVIQLVITPNLWGPYADLLRSDFQNHGYRLPYHFISCSELQPSGDMIFPLNSCVYRVTKISS